MGWCRRICVIAKADAKVAADGIFEHYRHFMRVRARDRRGEGAAPEIGRNRGVRTDRQVPAIDGRVGTAGLDRLRGSASHPRAHPGILKPGRWVEIGGMDLPAVPYPERLGQSRPGVAILSQGERNEKATDYAEIDGYGPTLRPKWARGSTRNAARQSA